MQVDVLLFAGAAEMVGQRRVTVELRGTAATLGDVAEALAAAHPQLTAMLRTSRWAVDQHFAPLSTMLGGGEEIAFIPPVSGG